MGACQCPSNATCSAFRDHPRISTIRRCNLRQLLAGLALVALAITGAAHAQAPKADPDNTLVVELKTGRVLIQLRPDLAPKHVARVKQLAKEGFYNNIK